VHPELLQREHLPSAAGEPTSGGARYREINDWERYLVDNGIRVVKVLLNVSRGEQRRRFLERVERPEKNWKFSAADVSEREHWEDYQQALSDVLSRTSTDWAPWHVVPADHKWFTRIAIRAARGPLGRSHAAAADRGAVGPRARAARCGGRA
jgi:polyphosphate kinase 2 (PPK2 family)